MIVVGNRGDGPLTKLMLGSVASRLLQTAGCPVLMVQARQQAERSTVTSDIPPGLVRSRGVTSTPRTSRPGHAIEHLGAKAAEFLFSAEPSDSGIVHIGVRPRAHLLPGVCADCAPARGSPDIDCADAFAVLACGPAGSTTGRAVANCGPTTAGYRHPPCGAPLDLACLLPGSAATAHERVRTASRRDRRGNARSS